MVADRLAAMAALGDGRFVLFCGGLRLGSSEIAPKCPAVPSGAAKSSPTDVGLLDSVAGTVRHMHHVLGRGVCRQRSTYTLDRRGGGLGRGVAVRRFGSAVARSEAR